MSARSRMLGSTFFVGQRISELSRKQSEAARSAKCRPLLYKETFVPYARVSHLGTLAATARKGKISRRSLLKGLSKREKELLPIKPSRFCKFLGTVPVKTGEIPLKVSRCQKSFYFWYRSAYCPEEVKRLPDPTRYFLVSGSWQANHVHLAAMAEDHGYRHTVPSLKGVLQHVGMLNLPVVTSPVIEDLEFVRVSPHTFPGILTQRVCREFNKGRMPDKATCLLQSIDVAKKIWSRVANEGFLDASLYACGGREKLVKIDPEITAFKEAKSRLILMPELPAQLVNMAWQQLFQDELKSRDGPIWIGRGMTHSAWAKHYDKFKDCVSILEGDWKDFDSKVSEELITVAFEIIRMGFPSNPTVDNFFNYFISGFVHKNIVTPGGFAYKISKGIPSGSCWTSLIGSLCNWVVWTDVLMNYPGFTKHKVKVEDVTFTLCGDDFLLGFKQELNLNIPQLRRWVRRRHGMVIKEGCGFRKLVSQDQASTASFLKTILTPNGPSIRLEDLYEQIVVPKTSLDKRFEYIRYVVDRLKAPPGALLISRTLASLFAYHDDLLLHLKKHLPDAHVQLKRFQTGFTHSDSFSRALSEFETNYPPPTLIERSISKWQAWLDSNWTRIYNNSAGEATDIGDVKITGESYRRSVPPSKLGRLGECVGHLYSGSYAY